MFRDGFFTINVPVDTGMNALQFTY